MGENEYGESGHLSIIDGGEGLNDAAEVQIFQGYDFYTVPMTLIACSLDVLK